MKGVIGRLTRNRVGQRRQEIELELGCGLDSGGTFVHYMFSLALGVRLLWLKS
jgi:hypothetical protein